MYLPKTLELLKTFGRRPLTGSDFIHLTSTNDIEVVLSSEPKLGFYFYTPDGRHTIALNSKLSPKARSWVAWHEFAHFLQNYYAPQVTAAFCGVGDQTVLEKQADNFAFIATTGVQMCRPLDFVDLLMRGEK